MTTFLRGTGVLLVLAALATTASVAAQPSPPATSAAAPQRTGTPQGVAVLALGGARDDAFTLARAVYGSSLRPRALDELRARILAGDPAPTITTKDVRELAELRASIAGDDAASRRLLASIAQQIGVQALLVVSRGASASADASDGGAPSDGGPPVTPPASSIQARLFVAETGEFDAARYEPDPTGDGTANPWRGTVRSLSPRFLPAPAAFAPVATPAAPRLASNEAKDKPFYLSPWLWGAIGAAVLIGGFFYFASQDTSDDPIHLQMKVPR